MYEIRLFKLNGRKFGFALMAILIILCLVVITDNFYNKIGMSGKFGLHVSDGPQKAIDFIKSNNIKGPIFNNTAIGSFLIWKLPEEKVFIDSRTEAYSNDFFNTVYFPILKNPEAWDRYSKQYNFNMIIIRPSPFEFDTYKFVMRITKSPDWRLVHSDVWAVIFVKKTTENAEIIRKYGPHM